ncbi:pentapeptide repeat-containing protein [Thermosynechococcaceae cyanobacterium BACA0444]|uniref:Pentapeptide repeat-containing protein n=1 Tax=Pseudocalidococcus azoricus BACA0444 TaxID=2918990 RepID=A0AAE4FPU8_9CYAN|nr:pentapeptide repeat-containing protein [Pseudocalidococcus azoricus]MDS3859910.1 pentapeptide repeat-containing protein [Pseudocalidococcus azoricus BACA0444]
MLNVTAVAIHFPAWFKFQARSIFAAFLLAMLLILGFALPAQAENYTKEALVNFDFSGQDLRDSEFTKANLFHSNLSHTDLRGVSFFAANLETADLTGADLRVATLDTARFTKANLTDANLEGAFAFNTIFDGAIIDGADFTDVDLRPDARKMLCSVAKGVNPVTGRATHDTLECDYL